MRIRRQHEGVQGGGAFGLVARRLGLLARPIGLPQRSAQPDAQRHQRWPPTAATGIRLRPMNLAKPIRAAVGLCLDRLAREVAFQVVGQGGGTLVPLGRIALQRSGDDRVEIALQLPGARLVGGHCAGHAQVAAEQLGFEFARGRGPIQPRLGRAARTASRRAHTRRRRRDRQRQHLLGGGIRQRQRPTRQPRECSGLGCRRIAFDASCEMPKSSSFGSPLAVTSTLAGFRSRWITSWPCA